MSGYHRGVRTEHAVVHRLTEDGYHCVRAASSKGMADVVAIKPGQVVLVSCKASRTPGPAERAALLAVASCLPGIALPIVCIGTPAHLSWWRLLSARAGDVTPWTPDEIGEPTT